MLIGWTTSMTIMSRDPSWLSGHQRGTCKPEKFCVGPRILPPATLCSHDMSRKFSRQKKVRRMLISASGKAKLKQFQFHVITFCTVDWHELDGLEEPNWRCGMIGLGVQRIYSIASKVYHWIAQQSTDVFCSKIWMPSMPATNWISLSPMVHNPPALGWYELPRPGVCMKGPGGENLTCFGSSPFAALQLLS